MAERPCIWLTRPQDDSVTLARLLKEQNIDSIIAPVIEIEQVTPALPAQKPDALLLSSRHACHLLAALPADWKSLPVFCIGSATAAAATEAGFINQITGTSDMLELLPMISQTLPQGARVLYLSGEDTRTDAVALLRAKQIEAEQIVAYKANAITALPPAIAHALQHGILTAAVFFSPRSAMIAGQLLAGANRVPQIATCDAYCLSLAVAEAAGALSWNRLQVSHQPTLAAILDLIVSRHADTVL